MSWDVLDDTEYDISITKEKEKMCVEPASELSIQGVNEILLLDHINDPYINLGTLNLNQNTMGILNHRWQAPD